MTTDEVNLNELETKLALAAAELLQICLQAARLRPVDQAAIEIDSLNVGGLQIGSPAVRRARTLRADRRQGQAAIRRNI